MNLLPEHPSPDKTELQAVAFFTDIEHRVKPVQSGIRIVLQYNVELEKRQEGEYESKGSQDENREDEEDREDEKDEKDEKDDEDDEDKEVEENEYEEEEFWEDNLEVPEYCDRMSNAQAAADKATSKQVLEIIKKMHNDGYFGSCFCTAASISQGKHFSRVSEGIRRHAI